MSTTMSTATEVAPVAEPLFTAGERIALAGFLAGYSGLTRDAYALDLRMFTAWCQQHGLRLFRRGGPTSNVSAATWRPVAGHARPSPAACARVDTRDQPAPLVDVRA